MQKVDNAARTFMLMLLAMGLAQESAAGSVGRVVEPALRSSIVSINGGFARTRQSQIPSISDESAWTKLSWIASISAGPAWTSGGKTQTLVLQPEIMKTYTANKPHNVVGNGELFLGIQGIINERFAGQLGLAVAATSSANLFGNIWDDAIPEFDNFDYWYKIRHTHLAVKGKMLGNISGFVMPYLSASLGVAWNYAHRFISVPKIFEAIPTPGFTSRTKTSFTYTLGVGLQSLIGQNWQVGVGYEFADWGKSRLGPVLGQISRYGLRLNHFYTNGLMFNLTYVA